LLIEASGADRLTAEGPDADRALAFGQRFLAHHGLEGGGHLTVHRAIPPHSGLGSGTQLALAVARALAELHGVPADAVGLAQAVGRGRRSAIGTWTFALGGFIVEGGRREGADSIAPLLARFPLPPEWRCVVAVPPGAPGLSGEAEAAAFEHLPPPAEREVEQVAHLVLMQLLPALVEADLAGFGAALTEVQRITGAWFAPAQGGVFAPGASEMLVRRLAEWGAAGVGQSSWGPAVYGLSGSESEARAIAARASALVGPEGLIFQGGFAPAGARVWRSESGPIP
jgi:beta-RFAP synthase